MATTYPHSRTGQPDEVVGLTWFLKTFRPLMWLLYAFLILWAIAELFPIIFMFVQALKTDAEVMGNPWGLPGQLRLDNFVRAWQGGQTKVPIGLYFGNSLAVTAGTLILLTLTGSLAGYALARFEFPGEGIARRALFFALAVPVHATLIPVFHFMGRLGLRNNVIGLILLYTAFWLPFMITVMRSYFISFPREIEEAALIDGCSKFGVFWRVVLPISRGAMASLSIVNVVGIWSELLFAFILMNKQNTRTLSAGMLAFRGQYSVEWSTTFAAFTIATVPTLLFFLFFQRQITKGMTMGAIR
jgi:raffinose/stachyose/melibiose transport system permease protein